jgi:hypothetical protein
VEWAAAWAVWISNPSCLCEDMEPRWEHRGFFVTIVTSKYIFCSIDSNKICAHQSRLGGLIKIRLYGDEVIMAYILSTLFPKNRHSQNGLEFFRRISVKFVFLCLLIVLCFGQFNVRAETPEPIGTVGHGGFFNHQFAQVAPTEKFLRDAVAWYRKEMLGKLSEAQRAKFLDQEKRALDGLATDAQSQLLFEVSAVKWLIANQPRTDKKAFDDGHLLSKMNAVSWALQWKLPEKSDPHEPQYTEVFRIDPKILERIKFAGFDDGSIQVLSATVKTGDLYIAECNSANVPTPPAIGQMDPAGINGWASAGFIPPGEQFIVGSQAEVRYFKKTSAPEGMCVALPRSNSTSNSNTIILDGVICFGKNPSPTTGKSTACFWDNQKNKQGFSYANGTVIPIFDPDPTVQQMAGGFSLLNGSGGICTDCHAGQNPYVIHPNQLSGPTTLGKLNKAPLNLPTFGATRYDPLVASSWPQNDKSLTDAYVPANCQSCHAGTATTGGKLPHLSSKLPGYCGTVLRQAVQRMPPPALPAPFNGEAPPTMPQFDQGSAFADADLVPLLNLAAFYGANPNFYSNTPPPTVFDPVSFCGLGPTAGPANRGDPHLTTTNDIHFDFQAAGEFTALKDQDAPFELQTRQTPVFTTFTPGANAYTGLASCVSLNTAVALQIGKHRVSYQSAGEGGPSNRRLELRIDGNRVFLTNGSISLDDGNFAVANGAGSITFGIADGTRIIVTPNFWSSQGYWYLDVEVINTSAKEGIMGHIAPGEWLPRGGNGSNFGPMPASLSDRFAVLNHKFADSWRVTNQNSLFDYPAGRKTADFTDENWPSEQLNCQASSLRGPSVREELPREKAKRLCATMKDKFAREECIFDVTVTGEAGFAKLLQRSLKLRQAAQP